MKIPFLLCDMGGTNIRFAVFDGNEIAHFSSYKCRDFECFSDVLSDYAKQVELPKYFVLAIPGVVKKGELSFVNNIWHFSVEELKEKFGFKKIVLKNDFEVVALGIPSLSPNDIEPIKDGIKEKNSPSLIIGAGTGLGVGVLLPSQDNTYNSLASEGGYIPVSLTNSTEKKIYSFLRKRSSRVFAGHFISGAGIQNIYLALGGQKLSSEEIVFLAVKGDALAKQTILQMFSFWGDVAGDLALAFVAMGGVYLTGNIIQAEGMIDLLHQSDFVKRFEAKGPHSQLVRSIPVYFVKKAEFAFSGLKVLALNNQEN